MTQIPCGEVLDIAAVKALYEQFAQALAQSEPIEIQTEHLQRVDAAGVQLLIAVKQQAQRQSVQIKWGTMSEALQKAAMNLGAMEYLK